jgi:hypothetical protein
MVFFNGKKHIGDVMVSVLPIKQISSPFHQKVTCIAIIQGTERVNTIAYMYCDNTIFQATYQVYPTICNTNGKLEKKMNFKDFFFYINHFIIIVGDRATGNG